MRTRASLALGLGPAVAAALALGCSGTAGPGANGEDLDVPGVPDVNGPEPDPVADVSPGADAGADAPTPLPDADGGDPEPGPDAGPDPEPGPDGGPEPSPEPLGCEADLDCEAFDDLCAEGACQEGSCVQLPAPCPLTYLRLQTPSVLARGAPEGAHSVEVSAGHGQPIGPAKKSIGHQIHLGPRAGIPTPSP